MAPQNEGPMEKLLSFWFRKLTARFLEIESKLIVKTRVHSVSLLTVRNAFSDSD